MGVSCLRYVNYPHPFGGDMKPMEDRDEGSVVWSMLSKVLVVV